jgi:hypothetical protein
VRQKESGRRLFLAGAFAACWLGRPALADGDLEAGGLTFRNFATADHGASFNRNDSTFGGNAANPTPARILAIDNDGGFARVRFDSVRAEVCLPLGWQAIEDWERGAGYSSDRRYRVLVWRVDFAFEGVNDAEHYAATKGGAIKARRPGVEAQTRKLRDGSFLLTYSNVAPSQGDSERRVVFDVVMSRPGNPKEGVLMTLGVPASDSDRGLKLMALLKQNVRIDW